MSKTLTNFLMKVIKRGLLGLTFFFMINTVFGQVLIKGKVTDENGASLPGVTVQVKNTTMGTTTDLDGNYSLNVKTGSILVFSFVGYETQTVTVNQQKTINVVMKTAAIGLNELVVVGYEVKKKADLLGAVGVVNVKRMKSLPIASIDNALQGQVAGVNVITSGKPGGKATVRIRGYGTLGNNNPLYIIDGVPSVEGINLLNPADIESIQVLKDASSSAIYGSRASNGVVIITTKKGESKKPKITVSAYSGINFVGANRFPYRATPMEVAKYVRDQWVNDGKTPKQPPYHFNGDNITIDDYLDYAKTIKANKEGTNWFDAMFDPGNVQNFNFGVSQKNNKNYKNLSLSYYKEKGAVKFTNYERFTSRINSLYSLLNDKLRIGENVSISYSNSTGYGSGILVASAAMRGGLKGLYEMPTLMPIYDINGNYAGKTEKLNSIPNPIGTFDRAQNNYDHTFKLFGNLFAEVEPIKNLVFKTSIGMDYQTVKKFVFSAAFTEGVYQNPIATLAVARTLESTFIWGNTATYSITSKNHVVNFMAGTEAINHVTNWLSGSGSNYLDQSPTNLYVNFASSGKVASDFDASNSLFSIFGKINYNFKGKYLASVTIRDDASSRFSPENRHAIFPAASLGWKVSNEDFFHASWIKNFKIRAGWGKTGNQSIGDYGYINSYGKQFSIENTWAGLLLGSVADYDVAGDGTISEGIILKRKSDSQIKWETSEQTNIGFDLGFNLSKSILSLSFNYYKKLSSDVLVQIITPLISGSTSDQPYKNLGKISNQGVELSLDFKTDPNKKFRVEANVNFSYLKNEIKDLSGNVYYGFDGQTITKAGWPISSFYGYKTNGIYQNVAEVLASPKQYNDYKTNPEKYVGTYRFKDLNGDGEITPEDRTMIGSPLPDVIASTMISLYYKNIDFSIFLNGAFGQDVQNGYKEYGKTDYWSLTNPDSPNPKPSLVDVGKSRRNHSDYNIQDASYLRIQNIQLGYNLPKRLTSKLHLDNLRVYAQAQNLYTFTPYHNGMDPGIGIEQGVPNANLSIGIDKAEFFPNVTTITLGINVSF